MTKPFATVPLVLVILLVAVGLYWFNGGTGKVESPEVAATAGASGAGPSLKAYAKGPLAALLVHEPARDIPPFSFRNGEGKEISLADFRGRVVLLNLWATWCAPCRKEMPDLARLQRDMGGPGFEVVALSLDRKGAEASAAFLKETGADNLALYTDQESKALAAVNALGLPATLLVNRDGKEVARLLGPADWASEEAKSIIRELMK
ncbi:MAG: TlpA family protein disulfide reductase [Rhizobiales bacterium]|nr:TlpA family protein disulfide reductase [Hyphomicrobiales bacterium]